MNRTDLGFALGNFAADKRNPESQRLLAGMIGRTFELLVIPEQTDIRPMLPRLVAAALANAVETSNPDVKQWRDPLEVCIGRKFASPATLVGLADDAMTMSRVIGEIIEQVTEGVVRTAEVTSLLCAAWNLVDANTADFFASGVFEELMNKSPNAAIGHYGSGRMLRFVRQGGQANLTFCSQEGDAMFVSLGVGCGAFSWGSGSLTPDGIRRSIDSFMRQWDENLMVAA